MYDERVIPIDEAAAAIPEIQAFISQRFPKVACFMTTLRKDGRPSIRQVGAFVEGWQIGTITQSTHVKNVHIQRNPVVTYHWIELSPTQYRSVRNVMVQGDCAIVKDPAVVQAFLERRAATHGVPVSAPSYDRWLLRTRPTYLRAEGFTGPRRPVILTEFPLPGPLH